MGKEMAVDSEHSVGIWLEIFENRFQRDLITLTAGVGGQRIPIHRVVLTANSKFFTALLGPNFKEANEDEFILDETDGPTLKAIVDFCYFGRIDLTEENVSKYLAIASSVELRLLERKCFRFFEDKLNINNAITTLVTADKYNGQMLRQKALDFVCELFHKLPPSHIDELDDQLLRDILRSDAVYVDERFIFVCLLDWFRKDGVLRRQHMAGLLELIRLPLIPLQYLIGDTMPMIYKEFGCSEYLCAEYKKRFSSPNLNVHIRQRRSIHCLFKQYFDDDVEEESGVKIERYSSALNEFEVVREIELGQRDIFEAILHEDKVYILGGWSNGVAQKSVSVFDLTSGKERVLPEMALARCNFASILVGKFIYVFGGHDGNMTPPLKSCERFDLDAETWTTLNPMSSPRVNAAVAVLNEHIGVASGHDPRLPNDFELFDPHNNEWITMTPMNDFRKNFTICNSKGFLYAMEHTSSIERYDPLMTRWTQVDSFDSSGIASSVEVNDNIYAIKHNGEFGEIKIDLNGGCSFIPFAKSKFNMPRSRRRFLFRQ